MDASLGAVALEGVDFAVEGLELEGSIDWVVGGSATEDGTAAAGGCLVRCPLVFMAQHKERDKKWQLQANPNRQAQNIKYSSKQNNPKGIRHEYTENSR